MKRLTCLSLLLFAVYQVCAQGVSDREILRYIVQEHYEYRNFQMDPSFPGDAFGFETYLKEEFRNPFPEIPDTVHYYALAHFEIDYFGIPMNVRITNSQSTWEEEIGCLDEEIFRLIYQMPPWYPGENNGAPAKKKFTKPITVTLIPAQSSSAE